MSYSTQSGRKIVCIPCRARKKRCDGRRPVCSSCRDRFVGCRYPSVASSPQSIANPQFTTLGNSPVTGSWSTAYEPVNQPPLVASIASPTVDLNNLFQTSESFQDMPMTTDIDDQGIFSWIPADGDQNNFLWQPDMPGSLSNQLINVDTPRDKSPTHLTGPNTLSVEATSLPNLEELTKLVDVYFRRVHDFLPVLHMSTFKDSLGATSDENHASALLYAVISLATCERQENSVITSRVRWYKKAKEQYSSTSQLPDEPIPALQAAVCLIFQGMMINDWNFAWLTLGKAWRQVVALGYHRLDSEHGKAMPGAPPLPSNWIQRESIRRIVWTLYILDRGLCSPVGLVCNIEDKYIHTNLPMDEEQFQQSIRPESDTAVKFTCSFDVLLDSVRQTAMRKQSDNRLHYLILAYMLLGRVVAHYQHSDDLEISEKESGFDKLEGWLVNLRLCLPHSATSLSAAPLEHLRWVVWLNVVMSINTIFLYHGKDAHDASLGVTHWYHCLAAARKTVAMIREAAVISADLLLNPHTASPLFCSSRILIIEYLVPATLGDGSNGTEGGLSTPPFDARAANGPQGAHSSVQDPSLKKDVDLTILVFERLAEAFGPIGTKFKKGMIYHLAQDMGNAAQLKRNGIKDIMSGCASWGAAPPGFGGVSS
ncbi:unnamed protein product [Periconia digitata]|uniref:Zn(2)-C6 fungal-type domain-containing protein n=1 Tax=Periconia digitata TaxID=1303443 RepID=A0A9W4USI7_9PLEO|nr:unnamed protein product [Periconia digitata]